MYCVLGIFLTACAATQKTNDTANTSPSPSTTEQVFKTAQAGVGEAALSPLEDINFKRDKIPARLKAIKNPYEISPFMTCREIELEVLALDGLLGRDWDTPPPEKAKLKDRAADGASTAFLDAVSSGASGLIPYRGYVRTLSGANRHQKKVLRAYERGSHRRTFLKGVGLNRGCVYPASPQPLPDDDPKVVFR